MVAQRAYGRSMGIESRCNLRIEIWRPRFVSFLYLCILLRGLSLAVLTFIYVVCSGAIRASALLQCWAALPPTALLSCSDHNPTGQTNLGPLLLHSLHFNRCTGHLCLPV